MKGSILKKMSPFLVYKNITAYCMTSLDQNLKGFFILFHPESAYGPDRRQAKVLKKCIGIQ